MKAIKAIKAITKLESNKEKENLQTKVNASMEMSYHSTKSMSIQLNHPPICPFQHPRGLGKLLLMCI